MNSPVHQPGSSVEAQPKSVALFVSDIHLSEAIPRTTDQFLDFLHHHAIHTERLYLLGDLFEYWAGDDDIDHPYHHKIIEALRDVADRGVQIFWIAGNRDFLVGESFAERTKAKLLKDPSTLLLANRKLILSHGDHLCTDDVNYMAFRSLVRQENWQQQFLTKPLAERKAIIESMRQASNSAQQDKSMEIMDVNASAVAALHQQFPNSVLIHGHTHRHAIHNEAQGLRYVLPDWDCDNTTKHRGGWLKMTQDGALNFVYL